MAQQKEKNANYELELENCENVEIVEGKHKDKRRVDFKPLKFTPQNLNLILACIEIDSTYRVSFDENNVKSSAWYIKENFRKNDFNSLSDEKKKEIICEVCKRVDKENATHLSVSSMVKNDDENSDKSQKNRGIEIMSEAIVKEYPKILTSLKKDTDGTIVDNISKFVIDQITKKELNKMSFASKFCVYMCRYLFDEEAYRDKFSIYDRVLCSILPYYMWRYQKHVKVKLTKDMLTIDGKNSIASLTKQKGYGYGWYRGIIDDIRKGIEKEDGLKVSRKDFDLMLWYYYKGDSDLIKASYAYLKNELQ